MKTSESEKHNSMCRVCLSPMTQDPSGKGFVRHKEKVLVNGEPCKYGLGEYDRVPRSRQRRYQLKKEAEGLCNKCGRPAMAGKKMCQAHVDYHRARARIQKGLRG